MKPLPPLAPVTSLSRPLSAIEYYHASIGTSRRTLDPSRNQGFFIHGRGVIDPARLREALDAAAAVHPGARLRLRGHLWWARWRSDGALPRIRVVDDCGWDMRSQAGAEFVNAVPLSLRRGETIEWVQVHLRDGSTLQVVRSHHAVMDGLGAMLFVEDVFRLLRGEPALGSNATFSDIDLIRSLAVTESTSKHLPTQALTGEPRGSEMGDEWRRLSLGAPTGKLLPRVVAAMAEFTHRHFDGPALFAIPVNLRRHLPELRATTNFSNMLMVPMYPGDGPDVFSSRLRVMLEDRMEAAYTPAVELFRGFPMRVIDRMLSRTRKNYPRKKLIETAVVSNVGRQEASTLSGGGFAAERMFLLPLVGSAFCAMICVGDEVEMTLNLPRVYAGDGRFDALEAHLRRALSQQTA